MPIVSNQGGIEKKVLYAKAVFGDEEKRAVLKSLDNGWLASGPKVAEFEQKVAALFGKKYGVAVNSGSSANLLALASLHLPQGSEVITPACTFSTTVSAIYLNGLVPVYIDVTPGMYTMKKVISAAASAKTKAILVPHLVGGVVDLNYVKLIAGRELGNIPIIDDSCFAAGTKIRTSKGSVNIEKIKKGDLVLTRKGYKKVLKSWKTGEKEVITRFGLTATPFHPVFTKEGIKPLENVKVSDIIYILNEKQSCIKEKTITDIHSLNIGNLEFIKRKKVPVYNLTVERQHEFFANNILVHNCDTISPSLYGQPLAKVSTITTTSFYGSHIITACGMGGMVMTDDKRIRDKLIILRDWGRIGDDREGFENRFNYAIDGIPYDSKFIYSEVGYNLKMNEVSAAFGLEQLEKLPQFLKIRRENFDRLKEIFKKYEEFFILPYTYNPSVVTNWLAFPLTIKEDAPFDRYDLLKFLDKKGIQVRVLFSGNITRHPAYKNKPYRVYGSLEGADLIMANSFLLGCHQGMGKKETDYIGEVTDEFFKTL